MPARTLLEAEANAESSRKRQRPAPTSDDSEGEIAARPNANQAKRARVDTARHATPVDDDDVDVDDERGHAGSPDSPPKTQYELMRDNNFEHLQHQDADDQRATQRLRFKPNQLGDNAVADNGILESITCINFMCHTRLHCELGPLLNFIVGENGSGKSAILTAITLCLGGKASSTNRGGSLKSFVKEGTEKAVLIVKIKNQGQDAYRHEVYGDSIIVERHFSKSGSSSFKVKTATGQIVSTKKQEVEEIVEYYALQLLKPEWSLILEKTFGNALNAFIVQSMAEQKLLQGLMNKLNIRQCPVFIGNRHPLNTDGKEPDPSFDTILRVLKIDNMMVRDQLIINHMIEQVILIPQRTKAEDIMFSGARPRNVKACLSFHDKKRDEGLRLVVNNSGGMSTSPVPPLRNQRPRMKADVGSRLAYQKETLRQLELEYSVLDREHRQLQQEVQKFTSDLTKLQRDKKTFDSELRHARVQVEQVQYQLDEYEGGDSRLTGLKAELAVAKEKEEACGLQYGNLRIRKDKKNQASSEAQAQLTEIRKESEKYEREVKKLQEKKARLEDVRKINLTEVNEAHASFEIFKGDKEEAEKEREKGAEEVATFTKQIIEALGSEERAHVNPTDKYEELEKQYQSIQNQLEKERRKRGMTDEEVYANLTRAKETYDDAKRSLEGIKTVNSRLRRTLTIRLEKWRKFQRYISSQSRANFIYLLSERGFRGKLLLDHERKALDLVVEPDKTEKRAAGRNTKTLSGGEKSFSSICLLLSIWEAMGSPLRCLDEFDVFMDNVNRAISTNMLITAARRSVNRQYIFITPNAIEGRNTLDKDVKIIRLTDPRQRTLADH
ncbi:P-loop containing nucleoside triphosphate hydrolase protein [Neurospora hispaniola]|uniref:P-loop containing nucleoside triphosphate hydrolase protein n=1 Tax=Neurospora hispaniola TaxID=588809 RepID=A0AAJ0I066_9PEZI|nr:P-loop containing nucleoside triphosphate hydrolase protein [Neurospora hispaniola]